MDSFRETFPIDPNQADVWHRSAVRILEIDTNLAYQKSVKWRQFELGEQARLRADRRETFFQILLGYLKSDMHGTHNDVFTREAANDDVGLMGFGRKRNTKPLKLPNGWTVAHTNLGHDFSRSKKEDD